jgi:hypothetical protein
LSPKAAISILFSISEGVTFGLKSPDNAHEYERIAKMDLFGEAKTEEDIDAL